LLWLGGWAIRQGWADIELQARLLSLLLVLLLGRLCWWFRQLCWLWALQKLLWEVCSMLGMLFRLLLLLLPLLVLLLPINSGSQRCTCRWAARLHLLFRSQRPVC
jgi:hypothetical protein